MVIVIVTVGTVCSLTSKIMLDLKSTGITNEIESFSFPLFQTFAMFFGMSFGLLMHRLVIQFNIPFPGYNYITAADAVDENLKNRSSHSDDSYDSWEDEKEEDTSVINIPLHMYFYLAIPAVFDLIATILCMYGLLYITVSTYQILRGMRGSAVYSMFMLIPQLYHHHYHDVDRDHCHHHLCITIVIIITIIIHTSPS